MYSHICCELEIISGMDVHSPAFLQNPYRFYQQRRAQAPLFKANDYTWTITGYDIMSKILAHPAAGRGNVGQIPQPGGDTTERDTLKEANPALQVMDQWMVFKNPPEHTQSRKLVADVFTLKMVEQLEPLMRSTMKELIEDIKQDNEQRTFEMVSRIAYPFPITVICEMIGIPREDRWQFQRWTQDFSLVVQSDFQTIPDVHRARVNASATELSAYFDELVPIKKRQNCDDLMTRLIKSADGKLPIMDVLANSVFLLFAGQETTTSLISNAVNAFLRNPQQAQLLMQNPDLIDNAVEECLRYDPSIQMVGRYALDDIQFDDVDIKKGDHMYVFIGAAGYDPAANPDPERFDITRKKIKHLAFARGAHHCLGAGLAKLEMKVVIEELIRAFPQMGFAAVPQRRSTWLMRGFNTLPVRY